MVEENKNPTKLHFIRVRQRGDSLFYDTQCDIRNLMPEVQRIISTSMHSLAKTEQDKADIEYLFNCFNVFCLRVLEDPAKFTDQFDAYLAAIEKVPQIIRCRWERMQSILMLVLFGLFMRRDKVSDRRSITNIISTATIEAIVANVCRDAKEACKKEFPELDEYVIPEGDAAILCTETGAITSNIKNIASLFIEHTGSSKWEDLAAACDGQYNSPGFKDMQPVKAASVVLAYPDYPTPYFSVEADS